MTKSGKAGIELDAQTAQLIAMAMPMTVVMRSYLSTHHLWAARHFARLAFKIESSADDKPRFDIQHRAYVTNSIFSIVSFMEAAVNELFQDIADDHDSYTDKVDANSKQLMSDFWQFTELRNRSAFNLLDKFQIALTFMQKRQFEAGEQPFQSAFLVVQLRNELVHYKPQSLSNLSDHKLTQRLKGKFQDNQLMSGVGNPWFPDKCLGYGCARWATDSIILFADEFFRRIEVIPNYQRVEFSTSPDEV